MNIQPNDKKFIITNAATLIAVLTVITALQIWGGDFADIWNWLVGVVNQEAGR